MRVFHRIASLLVDLVLPEAEYGHEVPAVLQRDLDEALPPNQEQLRYAIKGAKIETTLHE